MRVLLFSSSYSPESSPPQRRWSQFARYLRAAGWDVDIIAPVAHAPHGRRVLPRDVAGRAFRRDAGRHGESTLRVPFLPHPTTRIGRFASHCFSAAASVVAGTFSRRPDVLVATVPSLPILVAGFVTAKIRGVPFVADMRDAWPDLARDARIVRGSAKSLAESVISAIQLRSDLVVTVTQGFADILRKRGVPQVATVSNGVDIAGRDLLPPPPAERDRLEVLYLGNHGESQRLEVVIQAAALARDAVHLSMVGSGVRRRELMALAKALDAPVTFHEPVTGPAVMDFYRQADTCVVSLRDDWKSFETTIPSKTYEVLAVGRHVTGIVRGEARTIIEQSGAGDVVPSDPAAIAALWKELAQDRCRLLTGTSGRDWIQAHANLDLLAAQYVTLLREVARRART